MKKLMKNKRLFVTVLAAVLMLTAVVGAGTFAWFTSTATVSGDGIIQTAVIKVEAETVSLIAYDFPATNAGNFAQGMLENNPTYPQSPDDTVLIGRFAAAFLNKGIFIPNFLSPAGVQPIKVTPGTLLETKIPFIVNAGSNAPVYFRVKAADLKLVNATLGLTLDTYDNYSVSMAVPLGGTPATFKKVGDYYYCDLPIWGSESVNYNPIDLVVYNYIIGSRNGNNAQNVVFSYGNTIEAEIIQATNNAVYMMPAGSGWREAAGNNPDLNRFFVSPY
jgi:predicted ribosomally synthesized peptide with SipW-like signal peptide